MLSVTLLCVGKMKEPHYIAAFTEYQKRLGAYCRFTLTEIAEQRAPADPPSAQIAAALDREAEALEKAIPPGAYVVALCVEGRQMSSPALAKALADWQSAGRSRVCFVVGGSFGLSGRVKQRADLRLSMSEMTFPHHLFRVMLAEQVYRALNLAAGGKYHK